MNNKPTLIYFASRGRAEALRVILAEAGVDWDEHPIGRGTPPGPDGRPTDIPALQATGTMPFDAFPVYEEPDGFRLAQTLAIASYLGRTHNLHGSTPKEQALVEQMLLAIETDVRPEFRKILIAEPDKRAAVLEEYKTKIQPRWLGLVERNVKGPFTLGDKLTVADLVLFYFLETQIDNKLDGALVKLPKLSALYEKVGARPNLAAYRKSSRRFPAVLLPT
jgi:glutathione S-transferase